MAGNMVDGETIARMIRDAGIDAHWGSSGGSVLRLEAGPLWERTGAEYGPHYAVSLGPGNYGDTVHDCEFWFSELAIGPDDITGEQGEYHPLDLGARTERDVADLIIAQVQAGEPYTLLDADTLESMGFDSTGRGLPRKDL